MCVCKDIPVYIFDLEHVLSIYRLRNLDLEAHWTQSLLIIGFQTLIVFGIWVLGSRLWGFRFETEASQFKGGA